MLLLNLAPQNHKMKLAVSYALAQSTKLSVVGETSLLG